MSRYAATRKKRTVPCGLCGEPTPMLDTKRCDSCCELETRAHRAPPRVLARVLETVPRSDQRTAVIEVGERLHRVRVLGPAA